MSVNREIMRKEAKKIYKEKVKNIQKKNRISFSKFFKEYVKSKDEKERDVVEPSVEDFNFDDFVNLNEINDSNLEISDEDNKQEEAE